MNSFEIFNKIDEYESKYFWESPSGKKKIYKILGVSLKIDCHKFLFDLKEIIEEALSYGIITKRVILKVISSAFDPLGILSPIVISLFLKEPVKLDPRLTVLKIFMIFGVYCS